MPCVQAEEFLSQAGVEYTKYDVSQDREAVRRLVGELGSRTTPTIVVDGEVVIGFDRDRLSELLNK